MLLDRQGDSRIGRSGGDLYLVIVRLDPDKAEELIVERTIVVAFARRARSTAGHLSKVRAAIT